MLDLLTLGYSMCAVGRWLSSDDREVRSNIISQIALGRSYREVVTRWRARQLAEVG